MGNNLNIGAGIGEADVFNPAQTVQNYNNLLVNQQAKKQQELNNLAAEFGKASSNGIRDADQQGYMDKYSALQALGRQKINENDPFKKAQLQSQIDNGFQDLGEFVNKSKEGGQNEKMISNALLTNPTLHDSFAPDGINKIIQNRQLPITDPNYISDFNTLGRQVNSDKVLDRLDKHDKDVYDNTKFNTDLQGRPIAPLEQRVTSGNRTGTVFTNQKIVNPAQQAVRYGMEYDVNPDMRQLLRQQYPDLSQQYPDQGQFKAAVIPQLVQARPIQKQEKPGDVKFDEKPDEFYAHRLFEVAHPLGNQVSNSLTPAQIAVNNMRSGSPDAINHFVNLAPKNQYGNAQPTTEVDPQTNQHIFNFPAQVVPDQKAIAANTKLKNNYNKNPDKDGGFLGFGGTPIPFEKSSAAAKLQPETKIKKPAMTYRLDPNDPDGYFGQAAQMAADQNIKLPQLNQIEGIKGGHGQIPQSVTPPGHKIKGSSQKLY